ncbi:MAG: transposase [Clostridia bacterium]
MPSAKPTAQIGLSCIYDVCNEFILDISINRNNFDERAVAEKNIDNIAEIIEDKAFIVLFDRGYPSIENMLNRFEKGQKFLMRLSSSQFKREQSSMTSDDEIIEIKFDQTRINPYRNTEFAEKLRTVGSMFVRFVRMHLSSGETEYLATNLSQEEFNTKEISDLYFMRWAIETVYDTLKNKLEIENFTGTKPLLIEQDIYATVYLCNIIQDVIRDAEESLKREGKLNKYKHVMTINKNFAIGVMRDELIGFVATDSDVERRILFEKVIKEIQSELIPVRKGRSFNRHKNAKSKRFLIILKETPSFPYS